MKVIDNGHRYLLDNKEGGTQQLQFIKKEKIDDKFTTIDNGTTNEEVIKVLIDRCNSLFEKLPSKETAKAIAHLEKALTWLNLRTNIRLAQNVENTPLPHKS